MKFKFFNTLLFISVIAILFSCSNEDIIDDINLKNQSTSKQVKYKKVSIEEAERHFNTNFNKSKFLSNDKNQNIEMTPLWDYSKITETVYNEGTVTQVPVRTNFNGAHETFLIFIKDENENINGIITTFYPLKYESLEVYNGYVLNFDFNGDYLTGYQYQNGDITKEMIIDKSIVRSKELANRCNDFFTQNWNQNNPPFAAIPCPIPLSPVIITAPGPSRPSPGVIPFPVTTSPNIPPPYFGMPNSNNRMIVNSPDNPIKDLKEKLKCFNQSKGATVTIYSDQPLKNSTRPSYGFDVGHAFISIKQGSYNLTFGFYPKSTTKLLGGLSAIGDDGGHYFDVSISTTVNATTLNKIILLASNYNSTYHINKYNCTDYAIQIGNQAGIRLPDSWASYQNGGGSNPGTLGEEIKKIKGSNYTLNTKGGYTPKSNVPCK